MQKNSYFPVLAQFKTFRQRNQLIPLESLAVIYFFRQEYLKNCTAILFFRLEFRKKTSHAPQGDCQLKMQFISDFTPLACGVGLTGLLKARTMHFPLLLFRSITIHHHQGRTSIQDHAGLTLLFRCNTGIHGQSHSNKVLRWALKQNLWFGQFRVQVVLVISSQIQFRLVKNVQNR